MMLKSKVLCEFGPFRFDRGERTLWRDGQLVPLTPKALDTLAALLEAPGRLIEKDELIDAVWQDAVVEEGNLAVQISLLRKTLGTDSYIETVPRRGYRFVAPVRDIDDVRETKPDPVSGVVADRRRSIASLLGALVLLTALGTVWAVRARRQALPASVAVLPFQILQGHPDDQRLGVGLADAVITRLGALNKFVVRPTAAVRGFDLASRDPLAAGTKLGVEAVLDATVQAAGDRIRVNASLLRTADGKHLWTGTFDLQRSDLFTLEDQLAGQVARSLFHESLQGSDYRPKPEAYRLFTLGQFHRNRWTAAGARKAVEYAEQAIAIDPGFAAAHALKGEAWSLSGYFFGVPPSDAYPKAAEAAQIALSLDDRLSSAHHVAGAARLFYYRDFAGAEKHLTRALELNPNNADSLQVLGLLRSVQHRTDEGMASMKRSLEVDPTSAWRHVGMAAQYAYSNQLQMAIQEEEKAHELDPLLPAPMSDMFNQYTVLGDHARAIEWLVKMYERPGGDSPAGAALREAYRKGGLQGFQAERIRLLKNRGAPPLILAQAYTFAGNLDDALRWIEKAVDERQATVLFINLHPMYASLRRHPAFQAIVRKLGL